MSPHPPATGMLHSALSSHYGVGRLLVMGSGMSGLMARTCDGDVVRALKGREIHESLEAPSLLLVSPAASGFLIERDHGVEGARGRQGSSCPWTSAADARVVGQRAAHVLGAGGCGAVEDRRGTRGT